MKTSTMLWIVFNEDGDVTADQDRDTAIQRMTDQFGGERLDVMEVAIPIKRPADYLASITVRPEIDDDRFIHSA
jgi:hypothetical protein